MELSWLVIGQLILNRPSIFSFKVGLAVSAYILRSDLQSVIKQNMIKGLDKYQEPGYEGITHTWDLMQHQLHCCGVTEQTTGSEYLTHAVRRGTLCRFSYFRLEYIVMLLSLLIQTKVAQND